MRDSNDTISAPTPVTLNAFQVGDALGGGGEMNLALLVCSSLLLAACQQNNYYGDQTEPVSQSSATIARPSASGAAQPSQKTKQSVPRIQDAPARSELPAVPKTEMAPPCKNGQSRCNPWDRAWGKADDLKGVTVTLDGKILRGEN